MARDSSVHLVTRRKDANHSVLELRSSRDDGATWSEPTRVLSLTDGEVALPQPSLAITQRGALAVLHYDYVSSERLQIRARISRSLDGGATWRVTPVGEPFNYASIPDYRDGNALGFFNTVVAAGNDVTASVVLGGQQATSGPDDVFVATVRGS
jgi:hypothetical protein